MKRNAEDMTLKEVQYLIKRIEKGTLDESRDKEKSQQKRENGQRLVLKLIEEFGELAENIRKNVRFDGKNIKGTIEEEVFDVFYYVIAIANDYEIDLEKIFYIKDLPFIISEYQSNPFIFTKGTIIFKMSKVFPFILRHLAVRF